MEFTILQCYSCTATFFSASERATHHVDHHERLTLRDGTVLAPLPLLAVPAGANGTGEANAVEAMKRL